MDVTTDSCSTKTTRRGVLVGAFGVAVMALGFRDAAFAAAPSAEQDAIRTFIDEMYRSIQFDKGGWIDGDRIRSLMHPQGTFAWAEEGGVRLVGTEEFIGLYDGGLKADGIFALRERSLDMTILVFGGVAQVFDAYEAVFNEGDVVVRGINAFQLVKHQDAWKCASLAWSEETPDLPLPAVPEDGNVRRKFDL